MVIQQNGDVGCVDGDKTGGNPKKEEGDERYELYSSSDSLTARKQTKQSAFPWTAVTTRAVVASSPISVTRRRTISASSDASGICGLPERTTAETRQQLADIT